MFLLAVVVRVVQLCGLLVPAAGTNCDTATQLYMILLTAAAAGHAELQTLGVSGWEWRERLSMLHQLGLQPVIQYTAACGLHPDLVTRLAVLELACGPPELANSPLTWDAWVEQAQQTGRDMFRDSTESVCLPAMPEGENVCPC
jgi:hypothetical protein